MLSFLKLKSCILHACEVGSFFRCYCNETYLHIMSVDIRLASARVRGAESYHGEDPGNIVTPGDVITADTGFMRFVRSRFYVISDSEFIHMTSISFSNHMF